MRLPAPAPPAPHPHVGGQYVYLRDAFHPAVAFLYGWTLPLVVQTGGRRPPR